MKWLSEITERLTSLRPRVVAGWQKVKETWLKLTPHWRQFLKGMAVGGLMALCLTMCVGCAGLSQAAPQKPPCRVPQVHLQPIVPPPLLDRTGMDLLVENGLLRDALRQANADRADVMTFIQERCQ